jgi:methionyl-tRNA formyltransferase
MPETATGGSVIVLTTDTLHHRFFLNALLDAGIRIGQTIFETVPVAPPFPVGPTFEEEQEAFERERWADRLSLDRLDPVCVPNFNEAAAQMAAWNPHRAVVFGARRLKPAVIGLFPGGMINVHRGIVQEYRGLDSDLWAAYHRDWDNIGVTLHAVDDDLDTGGIYAQERLRPAQGMRLAHLRAYTTEIAARLMIASLSAPTAAPALPGGRGRYYSFMPLELRRWTRLRFDRWCERLP